MGAIAQEGVLIKEGKARSKHYLELEHLGWTLEAVRLHGRADEIAEPYED